MSGVMACLDENAVAALLEGALETSSVAAIDRHLDGCAACRELLGTIATTGGARETRAELPDEVTALPSPSAAEKEHLAEVIRISSALRFGLALWLAFGLADLLLWAQRHGRVRLGWLLALRGLLCVVVVPSLYLLARGPSPRRLFLIERACILSAVVLSSLLAIETGSLDSPYLAGISLILIVRGFMLSSPWRQGLTGIGVPLLVHLAVMLGSGFFSPTFLSQIRDPRTLSLFAIVESINMAAAAIAIASGHQIWALRRQLYEARQIGRYHLRRRIGKGGMGEVWAAYHAGIRSEVAIKFLPSEREAEPAAVARFEREVRALADLAHPNTVRIFDYGVTEDGLRYYTMELVRGETLAGLVAGSGPLTEQRALRIIGQVARALSEAHERGIIHRDIKPQNLMIVTIGLETDVVKVLDFGIAKVAAPGRTITAAGKNLIAGTPGYMAPEVLKNEPAGPASDVYAIGAVLYFMLAGKPPFEGGSAMALALAQLQGPLVPPSTKRGSPITPAVEALVARCLERDPLVRYASATEVVAALSQLEERPIEPTPPS